MRFTSVNPATGEPLNSYSTWNGERLEWALDKASDAFANWSAMPIARRVGLLFACARILREGKEKFAHLITLEMGKLIGEAMQEIEKCAGAVEFFASHGERFLAEEIVATDATRSFVVYQPLGTILAVMPWNFPFWQVFRAAVPILLAGNTVLLKHAPSVTGCALAIEQVFLDAGWPEGVFQTMVIGVEPIQNVLADSRVHGVTFTGGVRAGRDVAQAAGAHIKKALLELGGSDPFIVLEDADLEWSTAQAVASRFVNAGQSCIAAKRFIVIDTVADEFVERFRALAQALRPGNPLDDATTLAPLARPDLRDAVHQQICASIAAGSVPVTGCAPMTRRGNFYLPSLLDRVQPGMAAFDEEVFGPVAAVIRVRDEQEAVRLANHSRYGLGGSVWTGDSKRGERVIRQLQCGIGFVNAMVASDPRLPCGGIKDSGFGRELSVLGIREFANAKSVWIK
jgi:succinate-semialdehyde dehydrogenase/glutarate-semialdehyde dehydrogenase